MLWFVGDYASFDPRSQQVTRALARIFHDAGVDFGILYDGERNSGNDVRRVGEEGLFEMLAEKNIETLCGLRVQPHRHHRPALAQHARATSTPTTAGAGASCTTPNCCSS